MCRLMRSAAPIFLLLLPGLASCQSADPSRVRDDAAAADAVPGPQLHPASKPRVNVHGRLPGHLTIRLVNDYATTSRDPVCQHHFRTGGFSCGLALAPIHTSPPTPALAHL